MAQETVMIDFQVDYTELTNAQEQLAKTGKVDTTAFSKIQNAISDTATDTQGLIKTFKEVGNASIKMGKTVEDAFASGIQDALDEAGVSVKEFETALKKTTQPATSLKKEMLALKESLARMKAEGKDTGKEFEALRARAGKLSDAIADANAEIKNAGSDTRGLDNVVGSISAVAGGYAAVQGAAALFGEENEDLQKTLIKVNGAMALATGLQQALNAVQKEGALTKLADVIATNSQTAAQRVYSIAVGTSTGAMKAFRIALLATGIGAIIAVLYLAAEAMGVFGGKTDTATDRAKNLADELGRVNTALEEQVVSLSRAGDIALEKLKQRGTAEKDVHERSIQNIKDENDLLTRGNAARIKALGVEGTVRNKIEADALLAISKRTAESGLASKGNQAILDEEVKGLQEVSDTFKKISDNDAEIALSNEKFKTKIAEKGIEDRKKFLEKQKEELKKAQKELQDQDNEAAKNAIAANLDRVNKEIEQERIGFENKQDIDVQDKETKEKNAKDWDNQWKSFQESLTKSSEIETNKRKKLTDEERDHLIKTINTVVEVASRVAGVFAALGELKTQQDAVEIASQRRKVEEELKAGVITQKAAEARQKQIDRLERIAKQRAAEREKRAATFTAILAIPKAFLQGLSQGGIYLAAVYAALAAVEAGIIASKPVPRFFKGKKDSYQGLGIVGDMGAELAEQNGRMYLYTKPTQTYLGAKDKVYTAGETRSIMHNSHLSTTPTRAQSERFDYDRFAKAIPKDSININIDKEFISESVGKGLSRINYMDRRYKSK